MKKNVPWDILAPSAVACDRLFLRECAFDTLVPFYAWRNSGRISPCIRTDFGDSIP